MTEDKYKKLAEQTLALQNEARARIKDFDKFTIEQLEPIHDIAKRYLDAKDLKDYLISDTLREELNKRGVIVEKLTRATYELFGLPMSLFRESSQCRKNRLST